MAAALVDLAVVAVYSLTLVYRRRLDRGGRHGVGVGIPRTTGGLIAFGQLVVVGVAIFTGHRMIVEDYIFLFVTALVVYLAWRTYKRPTVLLNCIAFAWIGLLELGFKIIVMLAANYVNVAPLWMPILGTIAAVGGIRGSLAVRRFEAIAASAGAAVSS